MTSASNRNTENSRSIAVDTPDVLPPPNDAAAACARAFHEERRRRAASAAVCALAVLAAAPIALGIRAPQDARSPRDRIRTGIDPNRAAWYELAQLPGVGEVLARRIVETREAALRRASPGENAFDRPSKLLRVKGIGPRVLKRLAPFLRIDESRP